jgi:DNA-binding response OmpR family regulator
MGFPAPGRPHSAVIASSQPRDRSADCTPRRNAILSVDDDPATREVVNWALSLAGLDVETASSGAEALSRARQIRFDLMLVDQQLPDMRGTDLIRTLRNEMRPPRFVLVSGFLTTAITVEAMKLGAVDVMEKPVDIDDLVPVVCDALRDSAARGYTRAVSRRVDSQRVHGTHPRAARDNVRPGSAAERWAMHVLRACESTRDLKTLEDWASFAGVSYSSLRECCHLLGIPPHDARDLTRVLRAVLESRRHHCSPEVLLDVSDGRTLEKLVRRAGFSSGAGAGVTPEQFLRDQRFVAPENAGLRILGFLLARRGRV